MHYIRIYADAAGESHFEEVTLAVSPIDSPANPLITGTVSEAIPAKSVIFRHIPAGTYLDWHPAPQRQFVIMGTGTVEITTSDGQQRQVGPGGFVLAEDVTGKGHITRVLPAEDWRYLWVPLAS